MEMEVYALPAWVPPSPPWLPERQQGILGVSFQLNLCSAGTQEHLW